MRAQAQDGVNMQRRRLMALTAGGLAALALGTRSAQATDSNAAAAPIQQLGAALMQAMRAGKATPFAARFAIVAPSIDQAFDLATVLRTSVGPRWDALAPTDQARLQQVFRNYTIASYVANFDHFDGQALQVAVSPRSVPGGDQVVDSQLGEARLSYVMRPSASGWKAVDVLADGSISRVAVQRSDFRSLINTGGGAALVSSLQRKVADLSGGSLA